MGVDTQELVGIWTVRFKQWTWEYTFSADGKVTWRDPINNMHGSGGRSFTPKLLCYLFFATEPNLQAAARMDKGRYHSQNMVGLKLPFPNE